MTDHTVKNYLEQYVSSAEVEKFQNEGESTEHPGLEPRTVDSDVTIGQITSSNLSP